MMKMKQLCSIIALLILTFFIWCPATLATNGMAAGTSAANNSVPTLTLTPTPTPNSFSNIAGGSTNSSTNSSTGKLNGELRRYTGKTLKDLVPTQNKPFDIGAIFSTILTMFFGQISRNLDIIAKIIALGILCGLLNSVSENMKSSVSKYAGFACNAALVGLLAIGLNDCIGLGVNMINTMSDFLKATFPAFIAITTVSGAPVTSAMVSPTLFFISEVVANLVKEIFIPLLTISLAFLAIDSITNRKILAGISKLMRTLCTWGLGLIMTVFVGITTIQGIVGSTADGVAGKAVKYTISTMIPVAGKYLTDSADTVLSSFSILRNSAGIGIVIGTIIICAVPLLQILAVSFIYKLAAVIVGPFVNEKFEDLVSETSNILVQMAGMVAIVMVMFIIVIATMISASNNVVMFR